MPRELWYFPLYSLLMISLYYFKNAFWNSLLENINLLQTLLLVKEWEENNQIYGFFKNNLS